MDTLYFILLLLGAVCFFAAVVESVSRREVAPRLNFVALGLLFWVLVPLIVAGKAL